MLPADIVTSLLQLLQLQLPSWPPACSPPPPKPPSPSPPPPRLEGRGGQQRSALFLLPPCPPCRVLALRAGRRCCLVTAPLA